MTEQQVAKLQHGIEAALRDLTALNYEATIEKGKGSARVLVRPRHGYDSENEPKEYQRIADRLRLALMDRGYDVDSDLIPPGRESEFYSFTVRQA